MIDNSIYREDIKYVAGLDLPWEKLSNKSILITGASGLIGSFLIDVLMEKNPAIDVKFRAISLTKPLG